MRGGVPGRGDFAGGGFQLRELHDPQLPGVHERVRRLGGEGGGSKNGLDYRTKVTASETASMWQSLSFGPNYKAAYCLAVCPAGEDVIGPFLANRGTS